MSLTKTPTSMIDTTGATPGQVLTFNNATTTWVASAAPNPNPAAFYTTVGNASAGIFAAAVAYTPTSIGVDNTGTWIAPAGCYSARITLIGGGATIDGGPGGNSVMGGNSRFNYATGFTPGANQAVAAGGNTSAWPYYGPGTGFAAWNGITSNNSYIGARGTSWVSLSSSDRPKIQLSSLSPAALSLNTVTTALSSVGWGRRGGWNGAALMATVAVTPDVSYPYTVGAGADGFYDDAYHGIVIIEW